MTPNTIDVPEKLQNIPFLFLNLSTMTIQLFLICCMCQERTFFIVLQYIKIALLSVNTSHLKILSSELWHVNSQFILHVKSILNKDKTVYMIFSHIWITKEKTYTLKEQEKGGKKLIPCWLGLPEHLSIIFDPWMCKVCHCMHYTYVHPFISKVNIILSPHYGLSIC